MGMDLQTLRDELREHVGVDSDDVDDDAADLLLNRSFWELMNKFRFRETECTAESILTIGDRFLSLPLPPHLFEALRKISVRNPETLEWDVINRISLTTHEDEASDDVEDRGPPVGYLREQNGIRIISAGGGGVDRAYTIRIKYWQILTDLSDTNTEVPFPQVWDEVLLYGAVWRLYRRLGNHSMGREVRNTQIDLINSTAAVESKEEEDSQLSGVSVPDELTRI